MVSLMPAIPLPSTPGVPTPLARQRRQKYTLQELLLFPVDQLSGPEIRAESNYLKNEKDYRGPRTFQRVHDGRTLLQQARSVANLPLEQRPTAAAALIVGTNTSRQVLPEGATVVRRPGEVPRIPDLDADRPSDTRAAQRPVLVAPWTEWDANNPKGQPLPNVTSEDKIKVRQLKKEIAKWLEDDKPTRQQSDQIGAIRSTSEAYVSLLRSMVEVGAWER